MKNQITISSTFALLSLLIGAPGFAAQLSSQQIVKGGRAYVEYKTANGSKEVCVLPAGSALADYKAGDLAEELKLCGKNFYSNATQNLVGQLDVTTPPQVLANSPYAVCPKLNSTNPGILLVEIPANWSREQASQAFCKTKSNISKDVRDLYEVDAKFKQSITCSYAPSALAAYHVSRMLGNAGHTPVAVVRTMDADAHKSVIDKALALLSGSTGDVIYKTWSQFANASASRQEPKLFADGGEVLYGALSENIKKEFIYTEVSGVGPYDTRYTRFLQQNPFKRIANDAGVLQIAGGNDHYSNLLPVVQQMRDVSEMVLLDTLLSQDDRIGNIHFQLYKAVVTEKEPGKKKLGKDKLTKEELAKVLALIPSPSRASESALADAAKKLGLGTLVRVMVLKDNDCGVDVDKRSNMMRTIDGIEQVRHMDPKTYGLLMKLSKAATDAQLKDFFVSTLLYRPVDFDGGKKSFLANLKKAAEVLYQNCKSGVLKRDLTDSFDPITGKWTPATAASCDVI